MDYEKLLTLGCDLGYHLLLSGAEIYRAEESVGYLLAAYGVETCEVFAIPNCITVSLIAPDQRPLTRIRRVGGHGTDVHKLESLNDLCRRLCRETPDLETARQLLQDASQDHAQFTLPQQLAAHFLGTSSFCLFFGGDLLDALCSGLCGVSIGLCITFMARLGTNFFFKTIVGGFICGLVAVCLMSMGLGTHQTPIITGAIMALVPGVLITNFMRDIIGGDMMSGLSKLTEALFTAAGVALGTGLALGLARSLGGAF